MGAKPATYSFLTLAQVGEKVALSKSEIYKRIREGCFPKQVPVGNSEEGYGGVRWAAHEIDAWIAQRIAQRDHGAEARRTHALEALKQRGPGPGKKRRKARAGFHAA